MTSDMLSLMRITEAAGFLIFHSVPYGSSDFWTHTNQALKSYQSDTWWSLQTHPPLARHSNPQGKHPLPSSGLERVSCSKSWTKRLSPPGKRPVGSRTQIQKRWSTQCKLKSQTKIKAEGTKGAGAASLSLRDRWREAGGRVRRGAEHSHL